MRQRGARLKDRARTRPDDANPHVRRTTHTHPGATASRVNARRVPEKPRAPNLEGALMWARLAGYLQVR